jgi:outer membrane protein
MRFLATICGVIAGLGLHSASWSQDAGTWNVSAGVYPMQPKQDSGTLFEVDQTTALALSGSYLLTPHWAMELFMALPAEYDMRVQSGADAAASFKLLPATLSVQYHFFQPQSRVRAYVGVGLTHSSFSNAHTKGPLAGLKLEVHGAIGPAAQAGAAFDLGHSWFVDVSARCFMIEPNAQLDDSSVGSIEIDPCAYGLSIGKRL